MALKSTKLNTNGFQMATFFQKKKKKRIARQLQRAPINSLNINRVSGYDNISFFFLRVGGETLASILSLCFSYALESEIFSSILKIAKVVQFFEFENKQMFKNYCPISLLPTLSKILEKLIKTRLIKFFDKYQVLPEFQYGFLENIV